MDDHQLKHYGVKGMKWGVRRTPEQLGHRKAKEEKKLAKNEKRYDKKHKAAVRYRRTLYFRPKSRIMWMLDRSSAKYELRVMRGKRKLERLEEAINVANVLNRVASELNTSKKNVLKEHRDAFKKALEDQEKQELLSHSDDAPTLSNLFEGFTDEQMEIVYLLVDEVFEDEDDEDDEDDEE